MGYTDRHATITSEMHAYLTSCSGKENVLYSICPKIFTVAFLDVNSQKKLRTDFSPQRTPHPSRKPVTRSTLTENHFNSKSSQVKHQNKYMRYLFRMAYQVYLSLDSNLLPRASLRSRASHLHFRRARSILTCREQEMLAQ